MVVALDKNLHGRFCVKPFFPMFARTKMVLVVLLILALVGLENMTWFKIVGTIWILFVIIFHERIQAFIFPNQEDDEAD